MRLTYLILAFLFSSALFSQVVSQFERKMLEKEMVDISGLDNSFVIDIKYATIDNFTGIVLYDSISKIYAHRVLANKLATAHNILKSIKPNCRFVVYDGARPLSVQRKMYEAVRGTLMQRYVANPDRRGLHNFGMAVDLSILDEDGNLLDMGTHYDFLGPAAGINREEELIAQGVLTREQVNNRKLLRRVMLAAGFQTIRGEWWHFNAVSLTEALRNYKLIY